MGCGHGVCVVPACLSVCLPQIADMFRMQTRRLDVGGREGEGAEADDDGTL